MVESRDSADLLLGPQLAMLKIVLWTCFTVLLINNLNWDRAGGGPGQIREGQLDPLPQGVQVPGDIGEGETGAMLYILHTLYMILIIMYNVCNIYTHI